MDFERRAAGKGIALLRTPVGVGLAPLQDGKVLDRGRGRAAGGGATERSAEAMRRARGGKLGDADPARVPGLGARDPDRDPRDGGRR